MRNKMTKAESAKVVKQTKKDLHDGVVLAEAVAALRRVLANGYGLDASAGATVEAARILCLLSGDLEGPG